MQVHIRTGDLYRIALAPLVRFTEFHADKFNIQTAVCFVQHTQKGLEHRHLENLIALFLATAEAFVQRPVEEGLFHPDELERVFGDLQKVERVIRSLASGLSDRIDRRLEEDRGRDPRDLDGVLKRHEDPRTSALVRAVFQDRTPLKQDISLGDRVVLMAGNALGIEEVRADELSAPEQTIEVQYYTVAKGDSLWKIAEKFYGNGSKYTGIFEENREVIKDPDLIFPGQKIRIPMDQ